MVPCLLHSLDPSSPGGMNLFPPSPVPIASYAFIREETNEVGDELQGIRESGFRVPARALHYGPLSEAICSPRERITALRTKRGN